MAAMNPAELIGTAREQVSALTGLKTETVSSLSRDGDDRWVVRVEALELTRVPRTMDVLGSYEITLSDDGDLVGFRRLRRYHRASTEDEG
jgi:hypothetical protein